MARYHTPGNDDIVNTRSLLKEEVGVLPDGPGLDALFGQATWMKVVKTEYIDLLGRKTNGAYNSGVVLKRTYYENGTVSTKKVMK